MNMELVSKVNNNTIFLVSSDPNTIESFLISIPKLPATKKKLTIDFRFDTSNYRSAKLLTNFNKQNISLLYNNISDDSCLLVPIFEQSFLNTINNNTIETYKILANKISKFINIAYDVLNRQKIAIDGKVIIKSSTNQDFGFLNWFYQTFPNNVELEQKEIKIEEKKEDTGFNFVVGVDEKGKPVVSDDSGDKPKIIDIPKEKIDNPYVRALKKDPPENILPQKEELDERKAGYANYVLLGSLIFLCAIFITFLLSK